MAYFTEKRLQSACGHTALGVTLLASSFVIPPIAAIWWCHFLIACGDVLLMDKSEPTRR